MTVQVPVNFPGNLIKVELDEFNWSLGNIGSTWGGRRQNARGIDGTIRMMLKWRWLAPLSDASPYKTLTPTPFAFWSTLQYTPKFPPIESGQHDLIPGTKMWPTYDVWCPVLEYKGDTMSPWRFMHMDTVDFRFRTRIIYKSHAIGADMPDINVKVMIEY
jgi:hypothetical protein